MPVNYIDKNEIRSYKIPVNDKSIPSKALSSPEM